MMVPRSSPAVGGARLAGRHQSSVTEMLSQMPSEQLHLLKRLKHEGCVEVHGEGCICDLEPLLEVGLIRTVDRGGPTLIVLTGRGIQASETPYSI